MESIQNWLKEKIGGKPMPWFGLSFTDFLFNQYQNILVKTVTNIGLRITG